MFRGKGGRVEDKVWRKVKSLLVSTHVKGASLSFTQMLHGSGGELLIAITVSFKKHKM